MNGRFRKKLIKWKYEVKETGVFQVERLLFSLIEVNSFSIIKMQQKGFKLMMVKRPAAQQKSSLLPDKAPVYDFPKEVRNMKIIISPAKKMNINTDTFPVRGQPQFLEEAGVLCRKIQSMSLEEAQALWKCNDKLAGLNFRRFQEMDLESSLTPAVLAYEGLQYQHMAPEVLSLDGLRYIEEHLRILSGFYGVLRPFDGVVPYRLEMQAKLSVNGKKDLYDYWGDKLYHAVTEQEHTIFNLASKEYSRILQKYLKEGDRFVTVEFGELVNGKVRQKGTFAKMARGEMVRFMAENQIKSREKLEAFCSLGLKYREDLSDEDRMVFLI